MAEVLDACEGGPQWMTGKAKGGRRLLRLSFLGLARCTVCRLKALKLHLPKLSFPALDELY